MNAEALHERPSATLGAAVPAGWRPAFEAVPRHAFIPDVVWIEDGPGWVPLSRHDDPKRWRELVCRDGYVVTQVDDGREPAPGAVGEYSTSSASQPSLVLWMLDQLDPRPGERVLEIGTGTGYSAALLCHRLGDDHVTTVEVDEQLAERARKALAEAGRLPAVVTADGLAGWPAGAPYDRVISTASVQQIPQTWIDQTRPGGTILTPWGNSYHNDALVRLTVGDDHSASGRFVGGAAFMWVRSQRVLLGGLSEYVHSDDQPDQADTLLDPREVFGHPDVDFAVSARVRDCSWHRFDADDSDEFTIWLLSTSGDGRSWASADYEPRGGPNLVEQYGPRRLWDEVETAYRWWQSMGSPKRDRFGLTTTPSGHQIWLDSPDEALSPPT